MDSRAPLSAVRRPTTPLLILAAAFVGAGGLIHLREWLDTYRAVPAVVPGAVVVRIGFPINTVLSVLLAAALVVTAFVARRLAGWVVGASLAFEAASLATLILSRTGSVLGWMEGGWSDGANETRAVEIGALIALTAVAAVVALRRNRASAPVGRAEDQPC